MSLDFTAPGAIEVREDEAASIELRESAGLTHPAVEEAAILYANEQDAAALAALDAAVAADNLGQATEQIWAMRFDLYQLMGEREAFEQRALEYSVKFEKSPPTWIEQHRPINPALSGGAQAYVAFSGVLDEATDKQIKQIERICAGGPPVRVEFGKVQDVTAAGAVSLLKALRAGRKAGCELAMAGAEKFAELLARKIEPGKREREELWLLLLEIYQHMGRQDPFEEWALQYAITFEVSPPSWESRPVKKKAAPAARPGTPGEPEMFVFEASQDALQRLADFAAVHDSVVIDFTDLKRMDFVSAGMFLNALTNLAAGGKAVRVSGANQMLCALFGVLGINQVARVERRAI